MTALVPVERYPAQTPWCVVPRSEDEMGRALPHLRYKLIIRSDYIDSFPSYEAAERVAGLLLDPTLPMGSVIDCRTGELV